MAVLTIFAVTLLAATVETFTLAGAPCLQAARSQRRVLSGRLGTLGHGIRMSSNSNVGWTRPPPRGKMDVVIGAKVETTQNVLPDRDEGCNLQAYMSLPVDQYVLIPLPNKARLERKDENHFALRVPELQIFNVWLRPYVVATVEVTPEGVMIRANECKLEGSPEVERLGLNNVFEFDIKIQLKAISDPRGLRDRIAGRSEVNVWVDPPQIFRMLFPKPLMLETGNSVIRTSLNLLQTTFLRGLAEDYNKWATQEAYRLQRANSASEVVPK